MKTTREKFLKEVSTLKARTNLSKAKKYHFGLIDDINDKISNIGWDDKLDAVYTKYEEARDFADKVVYDSTIEWEGINEQIAFLENALDELGVEPMGSVADAVNEADRIGTQIDGLVDDLSSGVLA
jgi:hypothetical protein|tara:strand:+ start:3962 stop:4339 length:378 start_codon:yes stop_codon:yes gene_type:complete